MDEAVVPAPAPPEHHGACAEKQYAGEKREETGVVVAGPAARDRVVGGLGTYEDAEVAKEECECSASSGADATEGEGRAGKESERHEAADEMVTGRGARLWLEEVVIDEMQANETAADQDENPFASIPARRMPSTRTVPSVMFASVVAISSTKRPWEGLL